MIYPFTSIAETAQTAEASGLGALGLDVRLFLFQLVTFVLVLLVLRRFALPPIIKTLEARRIAVEKSLDQAKETEIALQKTQKHIETLLGEARQQAEEVVAAGHKEATTLMEAAESKAVKRAEHIVSEAQAQMTAELIQARQALKHETAQLVAQATAHIIKEKVDAQKNADLISSALTQVAKETT